VGDTTITATVGAVSASTPFSVTAATLTAIVVTPGSPSIAKGTTRQFTATGIYTDATTQDLTASLTWTSSDTTYATISTADGSRGLATGLLEGTSTIKATNGTLEGTTLATVCTAIVYPDTAPVTVTSVDLLVIPGRTVIVDGSALTGSNTLTWNGSAETDGAFCFKAGASTAVLTGGSGNDSFDFTTTGVVFNSADHVDGKGGSNTLMLGQVSGASPLANVTNIQTITFASAAPVSVTTTDALVPSGATLTVDASALSGANTFTWNGAAESNGTFHITTGASAATVTGGAGNDIITGGAGTNILNGGPGSDTINGGRGSNSIDGGAGSDTINLGTHTGRDTVYLSNPTSGADTITGFVPIGATHDTVYVGQNAGLWFIDSTATNVNVGDAANAMMVTASGPMVWAGGTNMIILADVDHPDSAQVVAALKTGGVDQLTFTHDLGGSCELLVVYSDGTDVRVVGINLSPSGSISAGTSSNMTFTDLATIPGFTTADLSNWTAADFHF
jgi:Ca2+-binding RTX toxin-like protein